MKKQNYRNIAVVCGLRCGFSLPCAFCSWQMQGTLFWHKFAVVAHAHVAENGLKDCGLNLDGDFLACEHTVELVARALVKNTYKDVADAVAPVSRYLAVGYGRGHLRRCYESLPRQHGHSVSTVLADDFGEVVALVVVLVVDGERREESIVSTLLDLYGSTSVYVIPNLLWT